jgi:hypothetical protein
MPAAGLNQIFSLIGQEIGVENAMRSLPLFVLPIFKSAHVKDEIHRGHFPVE